MRLRRGLRRQAVTLGLETLDLAGIDGRALATLISPAGGSRTRATMISRAKGFFADAIAPIERTTSD